jgi:putative ABC transport system permease protein
MKVLTKKIFRDMLHQKGRSLSIILIIAIAMGLYAGILLSYHNVGDTFNAKEHALNRQSVRYFSQVPIDPDLINLNQFSDIKSWDMRLSMLNEFELNSKNYISPMYGISPESFQEVNNFELLSGSLIEADNEILLTQKFIDDNDLEIGETLSIQINNEIYSLEIVGGIFSLEYIYMANPKTGLPDLTGVAPIWASIDFIQQAFGFPGINEILVRFNDGIHFNEDLRDDRSRIVRNSIESQIGSDIISFSLSDEPEYQMKEADVNSLGDFARVFGGVVLLIALFVIYDSISKLIANQRNYIGTMRALGGGKFQITIHYTKLASYLSLIGVLIGIPLSWLISYGMISEYSNLVGIPNVDVRLHRQPLIEAISIHLGLSIGIALISSVMATKVNPREAMSSSFITQIYSKKPIIELLIGKFSSFEPTTAISVRNVFRQKRKTLITIFTFAMSIVLMISAVGFMDSLSSSIDRNYEEYQRYDVEIHLATPLPDIEVVDRLNKIEGIAEVEIFINQLVLLRSSGRNVSTTLYAFQEESNLRKFNIIDGQDNGLVVAALLADELNVGVGDTVSFSNQTIQISGITNEIISKSIFMDVPIIQTMYEMSNNVTGAIITYSDGVDRKDVENQIRNELPVSVLIDSNDVKQSIEYLIQGVYAMIGVMVIIGVLIVALFSFNIIVLEIISRENEFVNLKSLGSSKWKMFKIIAIKSLIVSIFGGLLAIPLSYYITEATINAMMEGTMNIDTIIAIETFLLSIGAALIASTFGVFAAFRHVNRINLVDAMRNRVSN